MFAVKFLCQDPKISPLTGQRTSYVERPKDRRSAGLDPRH